jgi:hypothetical protein
MRSLTDEFERWEGKIRHRLARDKSLGTLNRELRDHWSVVDIEFIIFRHEFMTFEDWNDTRYNNTVLKILRDWLRLKKKYSKEELDRLPLHDSDTGVIIDYDKGYTELYTIDLDESEERFIVRNQEGQIMAYTSGSAHLPDDPTDYTLYEATGQSRWVSLTYPSGMVLSIGKWKYYPSSQADYQRRFKAQT